MFKRARKVKWFRRVVLFPRTRMFINTIITFCKTNKELCVASATAMLIILIYCFTYDFNELWHNAHVLMDVAFQLSLAVIASLIFYIFQVYMPFLKNRLKIQPIIKHKINILCIFLQSPFYDVSQQYLGEIKGITKLTAEDIRKLICPYKSLDFQDSTKDDNEEPEWLFGKNHRQVFLDAKNIIDSLLMNYGLYMEDAEKEILIQLKEDSFFEALTTPIFDMFETTGIPGDNVPKEYIEFQKKYEKMKSILLS